MAIWRQRRIVAVLLGALCLAGAGCEQKRGDRLAISGEVRFEGQRLTSGQIQFLSEAQGAGGGAIIRNGKYEVPPTHGLKPGKYRVSISSPEPQPQSSADPMMAEKLPNKERIPASFNSESQHEIEVTASGDNRFDFDIK